MTRWQLTHALLAGGLLPAALVTAGPATAATAAPRGGILSVVAGGPGGPDPAANVSVEPCGVQFARGQLYIGDLAVVYRVSQATGQLVPVAGSGPWGTSAGSTGDGVPAADAELAACGTATDAAGNLLLADGTSVRVVAAKTGTYYRQQMTAGRVYTLARGFNDAVDVELDPSGNLVVADHGTSGSETNPEADAQIWVVAERTGTFYGHRMTAGHMYVVAGNPFGYVLGNGVLATTVDLGVNLGTVRPDRAGNLVMADTGSVGGPPFGGSSVLPGVRVVAARSGTFYGQRMKAGYIYTIAGGIAGHAGNGVPALKSALAAAAGIAFDHNGNVVVADGGRVRVIASRSGTFYGQQMKAGYLYAIAGTSDDWGSYRYSGDGGPATKASFSASAVAVDSAGNVLLGVPGRVLTVAERTGAYYGRTMTTGDIYTIAGNGHNRYSGDGGPATSAELIPGGVTGDRPADLVAAVDVIAGVVRAVPGRTGTYFGRRMTAGDIYTIAGNGHSGYSGDGGPGRAAGLDPAAVAADPAGNVLVADFGNHRIRVVANRSGTFYGQQMRGGYIYTIAGDGSSTYSGDGGPALAAGLPSPRAVSTDPAGNVFVASDDGRVRIVVAKAGTYFGQPMTAGDIYTIAGDGFSGYTGIGGPATDAGIVPQAIAVDGAGNVLITDGDYGHNAVLVVPDRSGTFYGQKMTAGYIYAIAGPGTAMPLLEVASVAVDPAGNVAMSQYNNIVVLAESTGTYYGQQMTRGHAYIIAGLGRQLSGPAISAAVGFGDPLAVGGSGNLLLSDSESGRILSISP
jgi:trimeric autotransporter adhesin